MSLRLITGKVRSGKTSFIIGEIRDAVRTGTARSLLLVPEQYSHEAERELCEACGDRLSLYAEVMSFSGFARWSMGLHGGGAELRLDKAGRLLCMASALKELQPVLRVFGRAADNIDLQQLLLQEADTLRAAASDSGTLRELAEELDGELSAKLKELALILDTYDAVTERAGAAKEEPLCLLSRQLEQFGLPEFDRIYVDGFIDFTGLETEVLRTLLRRGKELSVCLPATEQNNEEFLLPSRLALETLREAAESAGAEIREETVDLRERKSPLPYFADHLFDYAAASSEAADGSIRLLQAENPRLECEAAAAEILRAVREEGCRWRDIAVAVRGFEDYRGILENCFRRYEIPLFVTRRDRIAEKPLPLWIESACDILLSGWDVEDVTAYLRCGLSGLEEERCDELCRYLYKWQLKGSAWLRPEPWRQHPDGYGKPWTEEVVRRLRRINRARQIIAGPLLKLKERAAAAATAAGQAEAMAAFLRETHAARQLEKRVQRLEQQGNLELRAEYSQLWALCLEALRQITAVLGDKPMDLASFRDTLHAVLAEYDIGLIPVALDRVSAGDFDRMRRRNIRRLIVLGCTDDRLPGTRAGNGIFNSAELELLAEHKLMIGGGEAELWREYAMIWHTLSLPKDRLILSFPATGLKGEVQIPAMVFHQAQRIFSLEPEHVRKETLRLSSRQSALALAVSAQRPGAGPEENAAAAWFQIHEPQRMEKLLHDAVLRRTDLSPGAVEALYGRRIRISPSRLESFAACRFGYYCNYGLKAEEDRPAAFRAPEIGTFIHTVLEQTAREVAAKGGFRAVSDEQLREITDAAVADYVAAELSGFREKSARFRYLFERVCRDVWQIVLDTAAELRRSDFVPLSFELDVSRLGDDKPSDLEAETEDISAAEGGEAFRLTGIADRVDGWIRGDSLWLRVVDYKTGHKKFSLSDVWYGRNMQMLLYLFTVCDHAEALYGKPALPAGILYLPAREELLQFDHAPDEEETASRRMKGKRRSGLVLDDPELIEAWEQGEDKQYIPVRVLRSDPLVSLEQMGLLRRHVESSLREMAEEIRSGSIAVHPSYVSESDNACRNCPYHQICRFEEGENGEFSNPTPRLDDAAVWTQLQEETSWTSQTHS